MAEGVHIEYAERIAEEYPYKIAREIFKYMAERITGAVSMKILNNI